MENLDFSKPGQRGPDCPMPLVEKYRPRTIADFIGLEGPKRLLKNLLKAPRPVAVLLVGPPGCGKTSLAMAFAEELPGTLHHISSQKCDVATLDRLNDLLAYYTIFSNEAQVCFTLKLFSGRPCNERIKLCAPRIVIFQITSSRGSWQCFPPARCSWLLPRALPPERYSLATTVTDR